MQSLCDDPVHSTEVFTKSANIPTELSLQQTALFFCFIITVTTLLVENSSNSDTINHRDSGEELTNPSSKSTTYKL
jgi:hypothetical protein